MESRYAFLEKLIAALGKIQVPLVGFDGTKLIPFLNFDDVGLYIIIPKMVQFFQISLDQAINIFFYTQLVVCSVLALTGFLLLFRSISSIIFTVALFAMFLRFVYYSVYDVYVEYIGSIFCVVPLFLYFLLKNNTSRLFNYSMIFSGIVIGFSHYIRSYSALPVLGFVLCMLLLNKQLDLMKKIILMSCLFFGIGLSTFYIKVNVHKYHEYAEQNFVEFDHLQSKHVFWHAVYLGFGFLKIENKDNIIWDDTFAEKKVKEKMPHISLIQTTEYENILKNEVLNLIKYQRGFFLWTIFSKLGILFMYLLLFANFGLLAFFSFSRKWDLNLSFLFAFLLSSITPVLALPYYNYSLSFITFSFIFGLFYINEFINNSSINVWFKRREKIDECIS